MSGSEEKRSGLTRRGFLKATAAVAGTAALAGLSGCASEETESLAVTGEEEIFHVVCAVNCNTMGCGMDAHVRDGKVCRLTATTEVGVPDGLKGYYYDRRPCLRGRAHIQWMYDPDRIKYPMRRVEGSERGAGDWERISWDEAVTEITTKFKQFQEEYGPQSVALTRMWGNAGLVHGLYGAVPRFASAIGATWLDDCLDIGTPTGNKRVVGDNYGGSNSFWDVVNANTLVIWAANLSEVNVQSWHWAIAAQERGTKIVCIDPRYTITASKADCWLPIKHGADSILILGLINYILSHGLADDEYMMEHTVAPYLVREDTGLFLRMSDLGVPPIEGPVDPKTGKAQVVDQVVVWDETAGKGVADGEAAGPSMRGSFEVNGVKARTALSLLEDHVKDYDLARVAQETGLTEEDIAMLAQAYANKPCATWITYGLDRYFDSHHIGHGWATLAAITGNYGIPGGGLGLPASAKGGQLLLNAAWMAPDKEHVYSTVPWVCLYDVIKTGEYNGKPHPIKALFSVAGNPFSNHAEQKRFLEEVLPEIEFVVAHDSRMNDTCRYADIVLPATHFFEHDDLNGAGAWLQINEKAVDPAFESKSNLELFSLLAEPLGVAQFFDKTALEVMEDSIEASEGLKSIGITFDELKKKKVMCHVSPEYYDAVGIRDFKFKTPSGKLEFYQERPEVRIDFGQSFDEEACRLPAAVHPVEAWEGNQLREQYPLIAFQEHSRWRVHSTFGNLPWLRELDPAPVVKLNPEDASARGIAAVDKVKVYNDRGYVVLTAKVDTALPSGMCNIPKGWQRDQVFEGGYQELTSGVIDPVSLNQAYGDVLVEVEKVS